MILRLILFFIFIFILVLNSHKLNMALPDGVMASIKITNPISFCFLSGYAYIQWTDDNAATLLVKGLGHVFNQTFTPPISYTNRAADKTISLQQLVPWNVKSRHSSVNPRFQT